MSPVRPAARRWLPLLGAPALLLLLRAAAVRGDCGPPPVIPHAQAASGGSVSFPEKATVMYICDQGFVKIPGKPDAVVCISNKWTDIEEFCNRSCEVPPRLSYAVLKKTYISKNYFPAGTVVEYECRPGYKRKYPVQSGKITCLDDLTWSTPSVFCDKKQCPNPGELLNGNVNITTDLLLGSQIFFSCDLGYSLNGEASAFCMIVGDNVGWSSRLPVCMKIMCPEPAQIENGWIVNEQDTYEYRQVVTYECNRGFILTGQKHISCTVRDDIGEWSDPPPTCKVKSPPVIPTQKPTTTTAAPPPTRKPTTVTTTGMKVPTPRRSTTVKVPGTETPTAQRSTTIKVPGTEVPTTQRSTTVNIPGTEVPTTPQKLNTVNTPATRVQPTPQKPNTVNVPDAEVSPVPQKTISINTSDTKTPLTIQKPATASSSVTKAPATAQTPPVANVLSVVIPLATQNPNMGTAAATQTSPALFTTAKASFTQTLPARQKSSPKHVSVTQRFTSAPITATRHGPDSRTTTRSTTTEKKSVTSGYQSVIYGVVGVAVVVSLGVGGVYYWIRRTSGAHMYKMDSFACGASNHWLADIAKEELRRDCSSAQNISSLLQVPGTAQIQ